jgi:hypothetical protein
MPSKRHEHDRACRCERADGGCAALAVQRLSRTRVQELAEEIWTVSTGTTAPVQPLLDPRGSRPGASAHAAYRRCRHSLAGTGIPVRRLLCLHVGVRLPRRRSVQGIPLVSLRRLPDVVRHGSPVQAIEVQRASARALEVLRPAA